MNGYVSVLLYLTTLAAFFFAVVRYEMTDSLTSGKQKRIQVSKLDQPDLEETGDPLSLTLRSQHASPELDMTAWAKGPPDVPSGEHHPELWKCPGDAWPVFRDADRHPWIEMGEGQFAFWEKLHHETMHAAFTAGKRRPKRVPWEEGLKA